MYKYRALYLECLCRNPAMFRAMVSIRIEYRVANQFSHFREANCICNKCGRLTSPQPMASLVAYATSLLPTRVAMYIIPAFSGCVLPYQRHRPRYERDFSRSQWEGGQLSPTRFLPFFLAS